MKSGVSFIICYFNCGEKIIPAIDSVLNQNNSLVEYELILVNNNSTDNSEACIKNHFKGTIPGNIKMISEIKQGLMYARLTGIKNAVYPYISFIDDDNRIEPDWTGKIVDRFESDASIGAIGPQIFAETESSAPPWFNHFSQDYAIGKQAPESGILKDKNYLWGAGLSIRKTSISNLIENDYPFLLSGRLGNQLSGGEDGELCMAIRLNSFHLFADNELHLRHYIPVNRLNTEYLIKINRGFGYSWVILDLYEALLKNKSVNEAVTKTIFKIRFSIFIKKLKLLFVQNEIRSLQHKKTIAFQSGYIAGLTATKNMRSEIMERISKNFCQS